MPRLALFSVLVLAVQPITAAQSHYSGSDRKTIEITATEKVVVASDMAMIKIGYQNLSATKDAAYAENTRTANKIIKAILDAGVPAEAIETESLKLEKEDEQRYGAKSDQPAKYLASQEWQIHSAAPDAQKIIDIAIAAGANQIGSVEWTVKDPHELEVKAYTAAINRAKSLAEQTASNTGLKLGEIISIANSANSFDREFGLRRPGVMYKLAPPPPPPVPLKLQPGTVEREASVTITYSVAP